MATAASQGVLVASLANIIASEQALVKLDVPALPSGFPTKFDSALAWTGSQFADASEYVHQLSGSHISEIKTALEHFKGLGLDGDLVSSETFPLPTLGPVLKRLSCDLHEGKGFFVLRGLDPQEFSVEDLTNVWLGVQAYIADLRGRQDKRGNMLVHIVADADSDKKEIAEHHRHSTKSITHHNEETGDITAWLTRSAASEGGKCIIASAYAVYNILAATRPDIIRLLARSDWPFALPTFTCRPVIFHEDSRLIMNFGRAPLLGNDAHPRPQHLPSLNARQIEALDAIDSIAKACELEFKTQAGDMHFINNLAVLHRREGFVNGQTADQKRHLVRMRLRSTEHGWTIPKELQGDWESAFKKQGGRRWHLEPMPSYYFPLRRNAN